MCGPEPAREHVTHKRTEYWGLLGLAWNQPGKTFTHLASWSRWCPYCVALAQASD